MVLKTALVIHPWLSVFGGAEFLALNVCEILQDQGFKVYLASDEVDPEDAQEMSDVLKKCVHIQVPTFQKWNPPLPRLRLYAFQRLFFLRRIENMLNSFPGDIVFSTQSSIFVIKNRPAYHFLYNIIDLVAYPGESHEAILQAYMHRTLVRGVGPYWKIYYFILEKLRDALLGNPRANKFIVLGSQVQKALEERGYNSRLVHPPVDIHFTPGIKKKQVCAFARVVPEKRLEAVFEMARKLPDVPFVVVGRDTPDLRALNPGYSEKLFKDKPANVEYIESPLLGASQYFSESRVYIYAGIEQGIGVAPVEASGAGCIVIASKTGQGNDVVNMMGMGYSFTDIDDAVKKVKQCLEAPQWTPEEISKRAKQVFGKDKFKDEILSMIREAGFSAKQ
jgi:glycosyltransferase involved in cell wall biosynthesis